MATAANRDFEIERTRHLHGIAYIRDAATPRDQRWPLVDQTIVDTARFVVARIRWLQELAGERGRELGERSGVRRH
jgi:hypothetical protein